MGKSNACKAERHRQSGERFYVDGVACVLNEDTSRPVALDTRAKALDAVRRLDYEPNDAAQRLVRRVDRHVQRTGDQAHCAAVMWRKAW